MIDIAIASALDIANSYNVSDIIKSLPFGDAERDRLRNIKRKEHQLSSLSSLLCLDSLIKKRDTEATCDVCISRTDMGKPYFKDSHLFFSISHSSDLSLAALSGTPIGIDIEFLDTKRCILKIAERFFHKSEYAEIANSSSPTDTFYSLWTRKEALVKLRGTSFASVSKDRLDSFGCRFKEFRVFYGDQIAFLAICYESANEIPIEFHLDKRASVEIKEKFR